MTILVEGERDLWESFGILVMFDSWPVVEAGLDVGRDRRLTDAPDANSGLCLCGKAADLSGAGCIFERLRSCSSVTWMK